MKIEIDTTFGWICCGDGPRVTLALIEALGETTPANTVFRIKRQGVVGLVIERIELPDILICDVCHQPSDKIASYGTSYISTAFGTLPPAVRRVCGAADPRPSYRICRECYDPAAKQTEGTI